LWSLRRARQLGITPGGDKKSPSKARKLANHGANGSKRVETLYATSPIMKQLIELWTEIPRKSLSSTMNDGGDG